jgi:hypothetical protein
MIKKKPETDFKEFAQVNFLTSKNINDVKKLTLCTTRQDLRITSPIQVECFSPREYEHKDSWQHQHFNYSISEFGFRGENTLPDEVDIAAFGCSFTFGQGLSEDTAWPKLLATRLGMSVYNFGQPATGAKNIADLFALLTNHVKITHAVFLLPPYHRLQIAAKNLRTSSVDIIPIIPNYDGSIKSRYSVISEDIYKALPEEELLKIFKDSVYLIDYLAKIKGIKAYYSSWDKDTYQFLKQMNEELTVLPEWTARSVYTGVVEYLNDDLARDMLHPGIRHHENWTWQIRDFIK